MYLAELGEKITIVYMDGNLTVYVGRDNSHQIRQTKGSIRLQWK